MMRMKNDFGRSLSNVSLKVQQTYEEMVDAILLIIQADLIKRWKMIETYFQVESSRLVESVEGKVLCQSSDVRSSLGKNRTLFSIRVYEALDVGGSSSMRPSVGAKKATIPREAQVLKSAKKTAKDP